MDHLVIQVEPAVGVDGGEVSADVTAAIKRALNFQVEVRSVEPGTLPRFELKGRRFFRAADNAPTTEN